MKIQMKTDSGSASVFISILFCTVKRKGDFRQADVMGAVCPVERENEKNCCSSGSESGRKSETAGGSSSLPSQTLRPSDISSCWEKTWEKRGADTDPGSGHRAWKLESVEGRAGTETSQSGIRTSLFFTYNIPIRYFQKKSCLRASGDMTTSPTQLLYRFT